MENPKNEDIKKTGEIAEVPEETLGNVKKEVIKKAEGYEDQFKGNDEKIENNLENIESPEAKNIRDENKDVIEIADKVKYWFEEAVKVIERGNFPVISMEDHLEALKDGVLKAKVKGVDLSFISDLDERIEGFEKKILEKKEKEEKAKPEAEPENLNTKQTETAGETEEKEKPEVFLNGEIFNITNEDLPSLKLLLGGGGGGAYGEAIAILGKIVKDENKIPSFYDTLHVPEKPTENSFNFELICSKNRYKINADLRGIENGRIGIQSEESPIERSGETDEPKSEPKQTPETEKTAEEIENEKMADEIEKKVNEEKLDEETKERLGKWDKEENKDQKIGEEKDNIKEKLGNRLIERGKEKAEEIERAKERGDAVETEGGARLINQENIKKILESRDELVKLRDEIGKEAEGGIKERKRIAEEIKTSIDPNNPELEKLNIGEKMMAKEAVSGFLRTTKDILSLNEIDYLLEAKEINFGNLPQTHEKRKIEMEELQEIIDAIEEYKKFMEEFEGMEEERREEAREELGRFVRWLNWVKENKKDLFLVLVAIGVIAGVAALVSTIGLPGVSVPAYLTAENAIKAAVGLAAVGAVGYTIKKKKVQAVLKTAGMAVGLPILGAAFIADSIFNSEKMDEWMTKLCGVSLMFNAGSKKGK